MHKTAQRLARASLAWSMGLTMMAAHPALQEATQLAMGIGGNDETVVVDNNVQLEPLVEGMNALQGALPGKVVTRFPPGTYQLYCGWRNSYMWHRCDTINCFSYHLFSSIY